MLPVAVAAAPAPCGATVGDAAPIDDAGPGIEVVRSGFHGLASVSPLDLRPARDLDRRSRAGTARGSARLGTPGDTTLPSQAAGGLSHYRRECIPPVSALARSLDPDTSYTTSMPSVADEVRRRTIDQVLALSPEARLDLAFALGEQDLDLFMRATGLGRDAALGRLRSSRQRGRAPSVANRR